ncbi:cyclophane-forming radical SAM peptide maturase AmcB [Microbispora sp. NBC_01389]|uniref:cyclophane-forming radical SAM peptide maturase AmcB n=1 Tax=Microbispora sp. NBC_01389 TaxID=2903584 RepID=UPI00324D8E02
MDERSEFDRWFGPPATLVLQPTTLCNLDCSYCYLPQRRRLHQMAPATVHAVATSAADLSFGGGTLDVVWHAGEPLTVGTQAFAQMLAPFDALRRDGRVQHFVQTNATLLTPAWCDLLARHQVRVGVSIDGPAALTGRRVDYRGKPATDRILAGISLLRDHGIPFSIIAVVGPESIDRPEEMLDFLAALEPGSIGLNIEEMEGTNTAAVPISVEQAERFWRRVLDWSAAPGHLPLLRDIHRLAEYLRLVRGGHRDAWESRRIDPIPTVAWNGDVALISPELAGITAPAYGDFVAGNIHHRSLAEILATAHRLRYVREFMTGLNACRQTCSFWDFCRGGQAGNRYFENGTFTSTETAFCRLTRQALITALDTATKEYAA